MIHILLKELLEKQNKTMYWLAKQTGLSNATISNMTNVKTTSVSFDTLDRMCEVLGCQVSDILQHESLSQQRSDTHDITKKTNIFPMMDWKSKSDIKDSDS